MSEQDAVERRALFLNFGDIVESIGCVLKCAAVQHHRRGGRAGRVPSGPYPAHVGGGVLRFYQPTCKASNTVLTSFLPLNRRAKPRRR
jgi:hypothetical protein